MPTAGAQIHQAAGFATREVFSFVERAEGSVAGWVGLPSGRSVAGPFFVGHRRASAAGTGRLGGGSAVQKKWAVRARSPNRPRS